MIEFLVVVFSFYLAIDGFSYRVDCISSLSVSRTVWFRSDCITQGNNKKKTDHLIFDWLFLKKKKWILAARRLPAEEAGEGVAVAEEEKATMVTIPDTSTDTTTTTTRTTPLTTCIIIRWRAVTLVRRLSWASWPALRPVLSRRRRRLATWPAPPRRPWLDSVSARPASTYQSTSALTSPASRRNQPPLRGPLPPPTHPGRKQFKSIQIDSWMDSNFKKIRSYF